MIPIIIYNNVDHALPIIQKWKSKKQKVAFTNGCFDILHKGHVEYLQKSKSKVDRLIVGINSDYSVRLLKGNTRPIQDQNSRASIIAALSSVDMVIIFDEKTPFELIIKISPAVIIKGGDYSEEEMIGREHVLSYGGEVMIIPFEQGYSTSGIIEKIKNL
ncbi:MAG: D-glycero-beta-D-manno-heptose 1-phosphate adenylyltransferase [Saprospiraceae bacterium]|nr:D-glycero-beta-D-manno-heptose 1-phosphate adenylyltransferase [Saprospiraceae bacterium]